MCGRKWPALDNLWKVLFSEPGQTQSLQWRQTHWWLQWWCTLDVSKATEHFGLTCPWKRMFPFNLIHRSFALNVWVCVPCFFHMQPSVETPHWNMNNTRGNEMHHRDKGSGLIVEEILLLAHCLILCYIAREDGSVIYPPLRSLSSLYGDTCHTYMSHLWSSISNLWNKLAWY